MPRFEQHGISTLWNLQSPGYGVQFEGKKYDLLPHKAPSYKHMINVESDVHIVFVNEQRKYSLLERDIREQNYCCLIDWKINIIVTVIKELMVRVHYSPYCLIRCQKTMIFNEAQFYLRDYIPHGAFLPLETYFD
ncbi:hypothetical protein LOAG_07998 [Loa loa]|uniref:Uncharacterized protein n=1 Tax=Loa loa TaxID=7209 RepID=A0A1S0TVD3_LOALO|nr:hypothetical protein LOAG_07998 [Loa loa]EFO20490.1 hypothetical protein LOAG_07998 [Loa loa]